MFVGQDSDIFNIECTPYTVFTPSMAPTTSSGSSTATMRQTTDGDKRTNAATSDVTEEASSTEDSTTTNIVTPTTAGPTEETLQTASTPLPTTSFPISSSPTSAPEVMSSEGDDYVTRPTTALVSQSVSNPSGTTETPSGDTEGNDTPTPLMLFGMLLGLSPKMLPGKLVRRFLRIINL